jgi:drug/metabolite transporter (DMT)-like permease
MAMEIRRFPAPRTALPRIGLGAASMVLAIISLLLFFLPIMSIPLSIIGIGLALVSLPLNAWLAHENLRWAIAGLCTALASLGIALAVNDAPLKVQRSYEVPRLWQEPAARPYVPPPAQPGFMDGVRQSSIATPTTSARA